MKKYWLTGLVLAAGLAFTGAANAQIKLAVAGPITGPNASFGAQLTNGVAQAAEGAQFGIAQHAGHPISFWDFTKRGAVVTAVSFALSVGYLWVRYFAFS